MNILRCHKHTRAHVCTRTHTRTCTRTDTHTHTHCHWFLIHALNAPLPVMVLHVTGLLDLLLASNEVLACGISRTPYCELMTRECCKKKKSPFRKLSAHWPVYLKALPAYSLLPIGH